ncbi:hypothetical protein MTY66_58540 [Mycolicibacterium sp. TY66]|nr:hypothetical protein MTY66_58540 [Mycolicibacterium sp. TY66]BCJ84150.1 hypothetical protein MTY81_55230 [Mycolicibacterium sp. TY81]
MPGASEPDTGAALLDEAADDAVLELLGAESLLDEHPTTPPTSAAAVALKTARRIAEGTTFPPIWLRIADQADARERRWGSDIENLGVTCEVAAPRPTKPDAKPKQRQPTKRDRRAERCGVRPPSASTRSST